ncbi:MAG: hypothetical protein CND43_02050 [Flavobacteriales bacterium MED-G15]|nr:MAG: hypothetical protein CND43_02050 [Flavobacteriales bacterium MED-G15]|tara:strand:- start:1479 stop:1994 length:516 start_codon:yes stop_codon:yes gene_type:complete
MTPPCVGFFFIKSIMEYARLTKEQFEALHEEFSLFLAAQSIDKREWDRIKSNKPSLTNEKLDAFSDMVWDDALDKINYLEHRNDHLLFLFKCYDQKIDLILIKQTKDCPSFFEENHKNWLIKNIRDDRVSVFESSRDFGAIYKKEIFQLIQKGAVTTDGSAYEDLKSFLSK